MLDEKRGFVDRYNHELIDIKRILAEHMEAHQHYLKSLIQDHAEMTGSQWARAILDDWRDYLGKFWLVKPKAADIASLVQAIRAAA